METSHNISKEEIIKRLEELRKQYRLSPEKRKIIIIQAKLLKRIKGLDK